MCSLTSGVSLQTLGEKYGTDKATKHSYLPVYEKYLAEMREDGFNLLELGVKSGASLQMWKEYFPNAKIYGVDVVPIPPIEDCTIYQFHQADRDAIERTFKNEQFRIIVDDASHLISDQILSVCFLWPKLEKGGYYFIEDVGSFGFWNEPNFLNYFGPFRPTIHDLRPTNPKANDDILLVLRKE